MTVKGSTESDCQALQEEIAGLRARLDEALLAVRARDEFLAVAAHELRNPLHTVGLQLALLQRMALASGLEPLVERTRRAAATLAAGIDRASVLLDVTRLNSGAFSLQPAAFDLVELIREVVADHAERAAFAEVEIRCELPAGLDVCWDRHATAQILVNLLTNAIKYGARRPVDVRVGETADGAVRIAVADRGPGISKADQERIFARFERLVIDTHRIEGFGLGLWLVRNLVTAHHGAISIDSIPGHGSEFVAVLPRDPMSVSDKNDATSDR